MSRLMNDEVKSLKTSIIEKIKHADDETLEMIASASISLFKIYVLCSNECERDIILRKKYIKTLKNKLPFDIFSFIPDDFVKKSFSDLSVMVKRNELLPEVEFHEFKPSFIEKELTFYVPDIKEEINILDNSRPGYITSDFVDHMIKYGAVIAGGFSIVLAVDGIDNYQDIDVFSKSLDFLRWFINENKEDIENITIRRFNGYTTSYGVYMNKTDCYLNYLHVSTNLQFYRKVTTKKGIVYSDIDTGYESEEKRPSEMYPQDLSPQEGDAEDVMSFLSKTFDISCCCTYFDGKYIYVNKMTREMKAVGIGYFFRKKKYTGKGFEFIEWKSFNTKFYNEKKKKASDQARDQASDDDE